MGQRHASYAVGEPLHEVLPAVAGSVEHLVVRLHAGDEAVHHAVEELLLAGDVAVERHRLDAEGLPEAAHRQPREALLVDVGDRGVEDPSAVERDVP